MSNKFVSTDPMDTVKTMEPQEFISPVSLESIVAETPNSIPEVETKPIQEIARDDTALQSTFTAQDLISENDFVKDSGGFYGIPGRISDIPEILFEKSNGVIGEGYGSKKN
jgi:hypothetical protein